MSKAKPKEAIIILIDIGENCNEEDEDGKTFLMKSKSCASKIIERKIFSECKDELGVIVMGSQTTDNALKYPNIDMKDKWLMMPNLSMMRYIDELAPSDKRCDWLNGLIVAIDLLKDESEAKKFTDLKIMMFSNLSSPLESIEDVDAIVESLSLLNIKIVAIGPRSDNEDEASESQTDVQRKGMAVLGRIVDETGGMICTLEEATSRLDLPQKSTVRPQAWNCDLSIGSNIFIPITGFKKFAVKTPIKWHKKSVKNTPVIQEFAYFHGDKQVDKTDVISSAVYGQTVVPISEEDKTSIKLTTEKSLKLVGFSSKNNTPRHMYIGDSAHYIAPRSGMEEAKEAITGLAKALIELEMVGIVQKVFCKGAAPRLGAIIPVCEHGSYFFYFVPLPYNEDVRPIILPSLKSVKPSQEQLDAVDKLIDDMDLSQYEEDEDPYSQLHNPSEEKEKKNLVFKALNPNLPLPDLSEYLGKLLEPKEEILENASKTLEDITILFPLQEIEQKTYRRGAADVFETNGISSTTEDVKPPNLLDTITNFVQSSVTEVGTIDPESNFLQLLEKGEPFKKVCSQMQTAIKKLLLTSNGSIGIQKPFSAIKTLRKHCIKRDASLFNEFISALKDGVVEENSEFWNIIVQDKLGLISVEESKTSTISSEEADLFYNIKISEMQTEENEEMEAEDMLDML